MNLNKRAYNTVLIFLAEQSPCTLVTNRITLKDVLWISQHYNMEFDSSIKDIQFVESEKEVNYVQLKFI